MAGHEQWTVEEPWLEPHCALGEGPFYEAETGTLRFVDIKKKRLHSVSVAEGAPSLRTVQLDVAPTVTCDIEGVDPRDRILVGLKYGAAVLDRRKGEYEWLVRFGGTDNERLRSNDGGAGPDGRFWLGTMTDFPFGDCQPEGSLYRMDARSAEAVLTDLTIPNSVGWSPDNRTMYFTHSSAQQVLALDYDASTGAATNRRVLYQHRGPGDPDGFRVDAGGNLWHAVYGEGRVVKVSPRGELVGEVRVPTRNPTCVQFVGSELVVTTAADEEGEGRSRELGGAVFRVDVGTTGLELFKLRM